MASPSPLADLVAATQDALQAARLTFGAPIDEIDSAIAGLNGLTMPTGEATDHGEALPDTVVRYLKPGDIKHKQAHALLERLADAADRLPWSPAFYPEDGHADIPQFWKNYAFAMAVSHSRWADQAMLTSSEVGLSFTVQAPHTVYPEHAHTAVELYYVISGKAHWKRGTEPWVTRYPGEIILHTTGMRHAMMTGDEPLVACAMWVSHTDAPVVIVRS